MADPKTLAPDLEFVRQIRAFGGDSVKRCYQCATCSTVCELSPDDGPFPRKEMLRAQWGLREELVRDGDIWLCHDCTDCSAHCPRGARPSDVMGALRQAAVSHYAWPRHLSRLASTPKGLPFLLLVPAALYALIFLVFGGQDPHEPGRLEFATAFPHLPLEILFFGVSGFLLFVFFRGGILFWRDQVRVRPLPEGVGTGEVLAALPRTIIEILKHSRLRRCEAESSRANGHLLMLSGFLILAIVGTIVGMASIFGLMTTPIAMTSPLKIFANVGAALALVGCVMLLMGRFQRRETINRGTWFDWYLLSLLTFVIATGTLTQIGRLTGIPEVAFPIYVIHLLGVYCLLTYIPFTKLAHLFYRTLAMHHGRLTGRVPPGEPLERA
jgi:quinone-modifying oxidoreductase subunit QmoC